VVDGLAGYGREFAVAVDHPNWFVLHDPVVAGCPWQRIKKSMISENTMDFFRIMLEMTIEQKDSAPLCAPVGLLTSWNSRINNSINVILYK
jgi:hypothetical protein